MVTKYVLPILAVAGLVFAVYTGGRGAAAGADGASRSSSRRHGPTRSR